MHKYFLVYYVRWKDGTGTNFTQIKLNFEISASNLSRVELKLKRALNAEKVVILRYTEVEKYVC